MSELEYLRNQLNLIIGFLDVSDQAIYEAIKSHDRFGLGLSIADLYENKYENFQNHITTSALVLGFTHFEDFLTKMICKILVRCPQKNKIKITVERFEELGIDYKQLLAEEQSRNLTFVEKINLVRQVFTDFDNSLMEELLFVNKMRNCLMHNNGFADERLIPKYSKGDKIILNSGEINGYGLKARDFANKLWERLHD